MISVIISALANTMGGMKLFGRLCPAYWTYLSFYKLETMTKTT